MFQKIKSIFINKLLKIKEKEYRNSITNLQKEILEKNNHIKEIYIYYNIISLIVKDIANKLISETEYIRKETEKRINYNIKSLDEKFQDKFDKDYELSDNLIRKIKELIGKINVILNNFEKVNKNIKISNKSNIILKKKINDLNYINQNLCLLIKKKEMDINKAENDSNNEEEKQNFSFYRKKNKNIIKRSNFREKENNKIIRKKIYETNDINTGQTYFTSNDKNSLTKRSNCKNNKFSLTNNFLSVDYTTIQNNESSRQKVKIIEMNNIHNLKNKIEKIKKKIRLKKMKIEENQYNNPIYKLIIKIIDQVKKDIVYNKINNKLLNNSMKILPYQSSKFRNKFIDKLLGDIELYKILNSKNLKGINYFEAKLFRQDIEKPSFFK